MKTSLAATGKSNSLSKLLLCLAGLLCFAFIAQNLRADDTDNPPTDPSSPADPAGDPPSRVARISFLDGTVSFQPGGQGDWGSAAMNRPVTVGDKLWADKASRAELQAGQASIHMGSMTALSFLNLDENIMQLRVAEGAVNFRVRELREGDTYEVDTPNLAFMVKQAGAFRIDVSENGDATVITAIRGEGEVTAGGKTFPVHAGDRAEFDGVDNPQFQVTAAQPPDGLDRWAAERDLREDNSTSQKYVSPDVPGTADLDDNGTWSEQPDYGPVWYPNQEAPGWAPYSDGYWNYVGPWGWTWIGYEPWGFAPYHYGRWGFIGGRWGWSPGPIYARPFYGPAFVGFLGGPGFGVGFGFGAGFGVGWFPLGFHEPYYPGFRASRGYVTNINIHNTVIRNVGTMTEAGAHNFNYAYAHNAAAVTATSRSAFVGGQAVNRGAAHITDAALRGATVSNRTSFAPTRQSSFGAANLNARATPPASVQNRSVMARTAPSGAASNTAVRAAGPNGLSAARTGGNFGNGTPLTTARSNQLSQGRPPSANTGGRSWSAQGNTTDHGTAPQGFGSSSRPAGSAGNTGSTQSARVTNSNRPPWAGSASNSAAGGERSYEPASRSNSTPSRSYSPPKSSYPASRSYSAPARSAPAPSHSSSGGGGSHGGGGGSHGGGHH
ncbi:MAG: DUF6600 domain-containing protein [Candidatus Acidiferrum sp.]|jgi:uncharacterized membrane protein YgcG